MLRPVVKCRLFSACALLPARRVQCVALAVAMACMLGALDTSCDVCCGVAKEQQTVVLSLLCAMVPTISFVLHSARYKFYLLTCLP